MTEEGARSVSVVNATRAGGVTGKGERAAMLQPKKTNSASIQSRIHGMAKGGTDLNFASLA